MSADAPLEDLAQMLRELADDGWKPLLYFDDRRGWVAYPQAEVHFWKSFIADDPLTAVRGLYRHARQNLFPPAPSSVAPPTPPLAPFAAAPREFRLPPPLAPAADQRQVTPVEVAPGAIAHVRHRDPGLLNALGEMARAAAAALRASVPVERA